MKYRQEKHNEAKTQIARIEQRIELKKERLCILKNEFDAVADANLDINKFDTCPAWYNCRLNLSKYKKMQLLLPATIWIPVKIKYLCLNIYIFNFFGINNLAFL